MISEAAKRYWSDPGHRKRFLAYHSKWEKSHRKERNAWKRAWRKKHPNNPAQRRAGRRYYIKNRVKILRRAAALYAAKPPLNQFMADNRQWAAI